MLIQPMFLNWYSCLFLQVLQGCWMYCCTAFTAEMGSTTVVG